MGGVFLWRAALLSLLLVCSWGAYRAVSWLAGGRRRIPLPLVVAGCLLAAASTLSTAGCLLAFTAAAEMPEGETCGNPVGIPLLVGLFFAAVVLVVFAAAFAWSRRAGARLLDASEAEGAGRR